MLTSFFQWGKTQTLFKNWAPTELWIFNLQLIGANREKHILISWNIRQKGGRNNPQQLKGEKTPDIDCRRREKSNMKKEH